MTDEDAQPWQAAAHEYTSEKNAPVMWYGGKGLMTAKLLPLIPQNGVYIEPFGGAASILFAKRPHKVEVYNDLNRDLVNLFRAFQCPTRFAHLERRLRSTLYAREEFGEALQVLADSTDLDARAWAFFVTQNQGFGGKAGTIGDWGKSVSSDSSAAGMAYICSSWSSRLNSLRRYHARMFAVQIDNRPALDVIKYWDSDEAVFYLDPPYVGATRSSGARDTYAHEMTDFDHTALVGALLKVTGKCVLSGYSHEIYTPLESAGWKVIDFETAAYAAGKVRGSKLRGKGSPLEHVARTERVWISPNAVVQRDLFSD